MEPMEFCTHCEELTHCATNRITGGWQFICNQCNKVIDVVYDDNDDSGE